MPAIRTMVDDLVRELVEGILAHDSPKRLTVSTKEALEHRIAPYKNTAGVIVLLYLLLLLGLLFWLICMPCPPCPWTDSAPGCFGFYMTAATLGIGLFNAAAALLIKRWRFADFHTAVAYHLDYGPHGLSIGLALWLLLLSILYLAHITI